MRKGSGALAIGNPQKMTTYTGTMTPRISRRGYADSICPWSYNIGCCSRNGATRAFADHRRRCTDEQPLDKQERITLENTCLEEQIMKIHRRNLIGTGLAGVATAATLPLSALGQSDEDSPKYAKLDAVLSEPTFKMDLFSEPVVIESVELLRYGKSFLCRVRSTDGAEGISVAHNTMSILYPIFVNRLQSVFVNQDARRLDELLDKAFVYALNFRLGGLGIGIPLATIEFAILDMMGRIAGKSVGQLIGEIHNTHIPVYQATEWREKPVEESVALIKAAVEKSQAQAVKIKVGSVSFTCCTWFPRCPTQDHMSNSKATRICQSNAKRLPCDWRMERSKYRPAQASVWISIRITSRNTVLSKTSNREASTGVTKTDVKVPNHHLRRTSGLSSHLQKR